MRNALVALAVIAAIAATALSLAVFGTCYAEQRDMGASVAGAVGACW